MAGEWSSDDLVGLLTEFAKSVTELIPPALQRLRPLAVVRRAAFPAQQPHAGAAQHRRALRPVQRPVRRVPRRDHDVLECAVRHASGNTATPRRRAAPQDRPPARRRPRRPGQPGARDRHRLGRTVHPRRRAGRAGPLGHAVGRAAAPGPTAGGGGRVVRPGRDRAVRLPRRRRPLRRRAVGRDDRGGGIPVLADLLSDARPAGGAGRPRRDPGHHHAARPDAGHPQHLHLDPEVHLPRRPAAVDRGDHRDHRASHPVAHGRHVLAATALRRDAAAVARAVHRNAGMRWRRWVSTTSSTGCGSSTWPTPRPVSGPDISTSTSGPSHRREVDDELRRRLRRVAGDPGRGARHHVPHRPPDRPLQRRRRRVGPGFRRGGGRRRRAGHR